MCVISSSFIGLLPVLSVVCHSHSNYKYYDCYCIFANITSLQHHHFFISCSKPIVVAVVVVVVVVAVVVTTSTSVTIDVIAVNITVIV